MKMVSPSGDRPLLANGKLGSRQRIEYRPLKNVYNFLRYRGKEGFDLGRFLSDSANANIQNRESNPAVSLIRWRWVSPRRLESNYPR